jgi:hypothetical protein
MRLEKWDTGEPADLLELRSPWAAGENGSRERTAAKLVEAFRDWQGLAEGTKQGRDGLYHAQISPAPEYAKTMTDEEWIRSADILGEELGFQDQERAIVLHGGTDGRKHLHIVWARTDLDVMKIIPDSFNYVAHERASHRMELEFGQEFVPGKHAKRDRKKQEEFPREEYSQADTQIAQRAGMTVAERKEQIAALKAAATNGQEFKKALEEAGYILAQGERGYLVVDEAGVHSVLSRSIPGMKKAQVEAFMADVPLAQLPTIEQAQALQKQKALSAQPAEAAEAPAEMTTAERKDQITALRQQADNAQAFKNALEQAGYVLAKGERQGFYLVDEKGDEFSLSKHVTDIKGKEFKAFMAPIDQASLPTVDEAKAIHEQRQKETAVKAELRGAESGAAQGPEASKFLPPELARKLASPAPAPANAKEQPSPQPSPPTYDVDFYSPQRIAERAAASKQAVEASKFLQQPRPAEKAPDLTPEPPPALDLTSPAAKASEPEPHKVQPPPSSPAEDPEILAIKQALAERQAQEARKWADYNALELQRLEYDLAVMNAGKADDFDALQAGERKALTGRQKEHRTGIQGVLDALQSKLNPTLAAEKAKARRREVEQLKARQLQERKDYLALIAQTKQLEIENLKERQALRRSEREQKNEEETERYIREHHEAKRIAAELEAQRIHEELEHNDSLRDGPPPPKLGKH